MLASTKGTVQFLWRNASAYDYGDTLFFNRKPEEGSQKKYQQSAF